MCIHWYDVKAADFEAYVEKWHNLYNKDIFITEFAPQVLSDLVTGDELFADNISEFQRRTTTQHR